MVIGNGRTALLWEDWWIDGQSVRELLPNLYNCIPKRRRTARTVADGMNGNSWARDIHGNLGLHEIDQYLQLWQVLQHTVLSAAPDQLIWKWTASSTYSAQSCYLATFHGSTTCCTWKLEAYLEVLGTGWPTKTGAGPLRDWLDMYCNITPAASYAIKSRKRSSTCCWNAPSLARHGTRPWPGCAFQPQSPTAS
uniref:Reverse transcriptase zinc-binding domain-containing protein n=1 Tax=Aegilops tauschii subsp. strangulata TaxID=200361 RepID=A0A453IFA1_AEGTS